jgi:hypothetical protein
MNHDDDAKEEFLTPNLSLHASIIHSLGRRGMSTSPSAMSLCSPDLPSLVKSTDFFSVEVLRTGSWDKQSHASDGIGLAAR